MLKDAKLETMPNRKILIFAIPLVILVFVSLFFWWAKNSGPVSTDSTNVRFLIPKGYAATQIAISLKKQNLIKSVLAFKVYVQMKGISKDLKPGEYDLSPNLSLKEIVARLVKGPNEVWVTIPEGLRREEIVERFIKDLDLGEKAEEFRKEFLEYSQGKEGYLFPDTYLFPRDITPNKVVDKMVATFNQVINKEMKKAIDQSKYSLEEILVMASLIEREAKTDEERPIIAGILWKRLETKGWLLQVDASVQYAVASKSCLNFQCKDWWPILTKEDLEIDSPYNTYKYKSLPPSPIANPGLSSLKAAIFPDESDYWFYIHDKEGQIHYARTIQEHNQNVSRYLGI